jgi:hypothetical protein
MLKNLIETFKKPTPEMLAQRELDEVRRELLASELLAEYAKSLVAYNQARITRLRARLQQANGGAQ